MIQPSPHPPSAWFRRGWTYTPELSHLFVGLIVFAAAYAGIQFTREAGRVAIIWPADAFMIAILLRSPRAEWIPYLVWGYVGNVMADWIAADPFSVALMLSGCNIVEIAVCVLLLSRLISLPPDLTRPRDLVKFVVVCGGIAPVASAALAAAILNHINHANPVLVFQTWFAADALGTLTIAPLLLMLRREEWLNIASRPYRPQTTGILLLVAAVSFGVFSQDEIPLLFLVYPVLILAAFRLRFIGAAIAMAILAAVSIPLTLLGHGPFAQVVNTSVPGRIVLLQIFLAVTVFTILPVAAVLAGRRRLERETFAARRAAERANAAKSAFLTNMSHELRTPMTGIIGMCDLLLAGHQTPGQRNVTETLERSARSFLELLNDLLDLAKIEAGRMDMDATDFRLSQIMKDMREFFAPTMGQKGLTFAVTCDAGEYDVLNGDPKRVRQILFNLVGNALKFTDKGSVKVTWKQTKGTDGYVVTDVDVVDTGIGMSAAAKQGLFRPFEQGDTSTSRRFGGTGLGLNICKQLVEAMGGHIGFESVQGRGSRFFFSLRLLQGAPEKIQPSFTITPARVGDMLKDYQLAILLVDDNATTRFLVTEVIEMWGHSVVAAENGQQAVDVAAVRGFDIILMDMQMPVMDGIGAVRAIRAGRGPSSFAPVIALTADAIPENRSAYLAAGCNAVVTKPIEWDVLAREIKYLVAQPKSAVRPRPTVAVRTPADIVQPVLDAQKIDALREGLGPELMQDLLGQCLTAMERYLGDARQGVGAGDHGKVRRAIHDLKSVCGQFGAARASEIAHMIDELPDIESIINVFSELEDSIKLAAAGIHEIRSRMTVAGPNGSAGQGHPVAREPAEV